MFDLMGGKGNVAILQGGLAPNLNARQEVSELLLLKLM